MSSPRDQQALSAAGDRPHVLVIDDVREIRHLHRDLLEEEGFRVSALGSDDLDLTTITRLEPNLIVLDGLRPGRTMDWSILHALKQDPKTGLLPVVLCTAAVREVAAYTDHLAAMNVPVVLKPFNIDDLVSAIRRALGAPPTTDRRSSPRGARPEGPNPE